jgi:hypothetical protein
MTTYNDPIFEVFGFFCDVFVGGKMVGSIEVQYDESRTIGYYGRMKHQSDQDFLTNRKFLVKSGTEYETIMYPLCGKVKDKSYLPGIKK